MSLQSNFGDPPIGPMTGAKKLAAFGIKSGLTDWDGGGNWYSLVKDPTGRYGNVQQQLYPASTAGLGPRMYQIDLGPCSAPVVIEYDLMFLQGFDLSHGGGKCGARIAWGEAYTGAHTSRGMMAMLWWSLPGAQPPYSLVCVLQDQGNGNEHITPTPNGPMRSHTMPNSGGKLVGEEWYHCRIEMLGGPQGYAKYDVPSLGLSYKSPVKQHGTAVLGNHVWLDFGYLYGGGSNVNAPPSAGHTLIANVTATVGGSVTTPVQITSLAVKAVDQTVGPTKRFQALFSGASGGPVTPTAQVGFSSADTTKMTVAPVSGTFDQVDVTAVAGNADGSPLNVNMTCSLAASPTYTAFTGAAVMQISTITTLSVTAA